MEGDYFISNIGEAEIRKVLDPEFYLEDIQIDFFHQILRSASSFRPQSTLLIQAPFRIIPIRQNVAHLHVLHRRVANCKIGHYVCIYYDGSVVWIYDSINCTIFHPDLKTYIDQLFPHHPSIVFVKVQQQNNGFDCGVFAIAFAIAVFLGQNPEILQFDCSQMRNHLFTILQNRTITMFPTIQIPQPHIEVPTIFDEWKNEAKMKKQMSRKKRISSESTAEKIEKLSLRRNNEQRKRKIDFKSIIPERRVKTKRSKLTIGSFKGQLIESTIKDHFIGELCVICPHCKSKNFSNENKYFSNCCRKGKLSMLSSVNYPNFLMNLLCGKDGRSIQYRTSIRKYNSCFAFASFGAQIQSFKTPGPFVFKIHGQIYHQFGALKNKEDEIPKYAQLYVIDTEEANNFRLKLKSNSSLKKCVLEEIDNFIRENNPFVKLFKNMKDVEAEMKSKKQFGAVSLWILQDQNKDNRRYNLPNCDEIAFVFSSIDGEPPINRDICVHLNERSELQRINPLSENCDPLVYPLLFPYGDKGWSYDLRIKSKITPLQYFTNRIAIRDIFNPLIHSGKLTQQYIIDSYLKVEGDRLAYIKQNQQQLRVELYTGLMDHLNNRSKIEGEKIGNIVILPSTFLGSPRFMQQLCQDGMAIVGKFGKPDVFITFTCNPQWQEITSNLLDVEIATDRPDLVSRVFNLKIKAFLKDLMEIKVFGVVLAYFYTIEWQKRGLPHLHLLLFLDYENKIHHCDEVDNIVSAEIPKKYEFPRLYSIISKQMIHGPCGEINMKSPCMENGLCKKGFPKKFQERTEQNHNGYPVYRRRSEGETIEKKNCSIDNRWVVPYNPFLSLKYNAHINVEICSSHKSIKYIVKYVHKGHDCATVKMEGIDYNWDEVKSFLDARYICAPEAMHRLLEFDLHGKSHSIIRLAVHLEKQNCIYFKKGGEQKAFDKANQRDTHLTAWFKLNINDENARKYLYTQIPEHYVWHASECKWTERKKFRKPVIARMYSVSPKDIERFHLRLLLLHVPGATSFDDFKRFDGKIFKTFQEVTLSRGLTSTDAEWDRCMDEASKLQFPKQLRQMFAFILCYCVPTNSNYLWTKYKDFLIEDFLLANSESMSIYRALKDIEAVIETLGFRLEDFGLPLPKTLNESNSHTNDDSNTVDFSEILNFKQKEVFDVVLML